MTGRKRKNIDSDRNSGPQKRGKGFEGTPVLPRNVVTAPPAKVPEPASSADRLPPTFSGCSVASTVPTRVIAPLRKYLPRSVFTSRITDTSAVQEVMVKGAPAGGQKIPQFKHTWPTTEAITLLAAILTIPMNRGVRVYCDLSWAIDSVARKDKKTGRYKWLPPAEGFVRSPILPDGKFQIRDVFHVIRETVDKRAKAGSGTWIELVKTIPDQSDDEEEEEGSGVAQGVTKGARWI